MRIAIIYLAAISGIEVFTNYYNLTGGVISHIILLAALIVHSSMITEPPMRNLLLSLTLAPLTRIMSLSMPLAQFSQVYWYLIIYPSLFAAAWVAMRRLNFTAREIGFTIRKLPLQLLVALSGVIFGVLEYFVLTPEPLVAELTWESALLAVLALSAGTGIVEEFIFRGVIQRAALEALGKWGLPYVAFLFAILHLIHNSILDIVLVFAIALFFGWIVKRTGSLFGVILPHSITNILLFLIIPYFF